MVDENPFHISPDQPVEEIIEHIHTQGGIAVACHPAQRGHTQEQQSIHLWNNHDRFANLFDAWEVANRDDLFSVIGLKKFNYIANSDFHELRHVYSWKTLLFCQKDPEAIKQAIRENIGVSIYLIGKAQMTKSQRYVSARKCLLGRCLLTNSARSLLLNISAVLRRFTENILPILLVLLRVFCVFKTVG